MSAAVTPPPRKVNRLGLEVINYKGAKTTLCAAPMRAQASIATAASGIIGR